MGVFYERGDFNELLHPWDDLCRGSYSEEWLETAGIQGVTARASSIFPGGSTEKAYAAVSFYVIVLEHAAEGPPRAAWGVMDIDAQMMGTFHNHDHRRVFLRERMSEFVAGLRAAWGRN